VSSKLAVFSVDQPIREVHFEGQIGPSYVTASSARVQKLAQEFLGVEKTSGPRGVLKPKGKRKPITTKGANLERADALGKDQAVQAVQQGAGRSLPVYYPTERTRSSIFVGPPRVYKIRDLDGHLRGAYRMVIKRPLVGVLLERKTAGVHRLVHGRRRAEHRGGGPAPVDQQRHSDHRGQTRQQSDADGHGVVCRLGDSDSIGPALRDGQTHDVAGEDGEDAEVEQGAAPAQQSALVELG